MDEFDLDDAALEAAERKATEVADRAPEIDDSESECEGCKI